MGLSLYLYCFSFFYLGVGEDGLEVGWAVWMGVYGSLSLSLLLLYFYLGAGEEGGRQVELRLALSRVHGFSICIYPSNTTFQRLRTYLHRLPQIRVVC